MNEQAPSPSPAVEAVGDQPLSDAEARHILSQRHKDSHRKWNRRLDRHDKGWDEIPVAPDSLTHPDASEPPAEGLTEDDFRYREWQRNQSGPNGDGVEPGNDSPNDGGEPGGPDNRVNIEVQTPDEEGGEHFDVSPDLAPTAEQEQPGEQLTEVEQLRQEVQQLREQQTQLIDAVNALAEQLRIIQGGAPEAGQAQQQVENAERAAEEGSPLSERMEIQEDGPYNREAKREAIDPENIIELKKRFVDGLADALKNRNGLDAHQAGNEFVRRLADEHLRVEERGEPPAGWRERIYQLMAMPIDVLEEYQLKPDDGSQPDDTGRPSDEVVGGRDRDEIEDDTEVDEDGLQPDEQPRGRLRRVWDRFRRMGRDARDAYADARRRATNRFMGIREEEVEDEPTDPEQRRRRRIGCLLGALAGVGAGVLIGYFAFRHGGHGAGFGGGGGRGLGQAKEHIEQFNPHGPRVSQAILENVKEVSNGRGGTRLIDETTGQTIMDWAGRKANGAWNDDTLRALHNHGVDTSVVFDKTGSDPRHYWVPTAEKVK